MIQKLKKILIIIFCIFISSIYTQEVKAETATIYEVGSKYYYYSKTSSSKYGEYYSNGYTSGTAEKYTRYKRLLIGGKTKAVAYCVQATDLSPKEDNSYTEINWGGTFAGKTWTEKKALIAGRIIEKIRAAKGDDTKESYVYIYSALNSALRLDGSTNFAAHNTGIQKYIEEAINYYSNIIKTTTKVPNFKVESENSGIMETHVPSTASGTTYYTGKVQLYNLVKTYGESDDKVTYKVKVSSSNGTVAICSSSTCSKTEGTEKSISGVTESTIYIKAINMKANDSIKVTVTASNSSTYKIARLWKHTKSPGAYQALVTYSSKKYSRTNNGETTLHIPNPNEKIFVAEKVDNTNGKNIAGSNLSMTIYEDANKTKKIASCTLASGATSCSGTVNDNTAQNLYYSLSETKAPDGYVLGTEITGQWNLNSSSETCKKSEQGQDNWTDTSINDCNIKYIKGNLCYDTEKNTYTEGECTVDIPDSGNQETNTDNTTPSEEENTPTTPAEPEKTLETQEKCYYLSSDNSIVTNIDQTKCDYDYLKISINKGNLRVKFPNTKNTVKISKQSITETDEIPGAELKICSTKPNDKGECTIVRNTLSGVCKEDTTDEENGGATLTNEFNCKYNNTTGEKTIDMHWFSGDAPKIWNGLPVGTYYLVETTAPSGYIVSNTVTEFKIDEDGKITSSAFDSTNEQIVLKNKLTSLKISKTDITTSKELPGATLSICSAYKDEKGNWNKFVNDEGFCNPVVLADGSPATWTSTDTPHTVVGLGVGTYYLVETTAPKGYSTAEAILFTMNENGTLSDANGKSLADNKLVMKDSQISEVKTSDLPILIIVLIAVGTISIGSYYYIKNNSAKENNQLKTQSNKIRKRKIHK